MIKYCPAGQYFDGERKFCTAERPSDCLIEVTTTTKNPEASVTTTSENPNIPEITTTTRPTITTTTTPVITSTTTQAPLPNPPRDPKQICQDAGASGSYIYDADCTKFVMCYILNGILDGILKSCPSGQYYHDDTKLCINVKPERCL
ncbi:chitin-binding domain protein cbd-1-like [Musca vetustissima]|uniref:chitin-binding domain protein cbd-1-like n=1 Tax=Musca vetustissima TaxID=27455 RepID=UPI002AB7DB6D|nr:chitin-binding domain protein cbd-1-like [Musca vetustissima]